MLPMKQERHASNLHLMIEIVLLKQTLMESNLWTLAFMRKQRPWEILRASRIYIQMAESDMRGKDPFQSTNTLKEEDEEME